MPSIQPGMSRMSRPQLYHNIGRNWSILIYIDLTFLGSKKRYFCDVFATNIWTLQTLHILKSSSDSSHCSYFMLLWPPHHISSWAKESQTMTTSAESPLGSGGFVAATFLKLGHLEAPGCDVAKHQGARWIVQYCPILSNFQHIDLKIIRQCHECCYCLASAELHSEKEMLLILCPNLSLWWFSDGRFTNKSSQGSVETGISGNISNFMQRLHTVTPPQRSHYPWLPGSRWRPAQDWQTKIWKSRPWWAWWENWRRFKNYSNHWLYLVVMILHHWARIGWTCLKLLPSVPCFFFYIQQVPQRCHHAFYHMTQLAVHWQLHSIASCGFGCKMT